jgi:hypothetical protein
VDAPMDEPKPIPDQKRPCWLAGIPICVLLVVLVVLVLFLFRSGIHVSIQNTGSQPLRSVVLFVTGTSYNLGDIPPGATAHATVHPTGESHLEIEFTDADGQAKRLDAGGYFEPGYRGTIDISIRDGVIQKNEQQIRLRWSLP